MTEEEMATLVEIIDAGPDPGWRCQNPRCIYHTHPPNWCGIELPAVYDRGGALCPMCRSHQLHRIASERAGGKGKTIKRR